MEDPDDLSFLADVTINRNPQTGPLTEEDLVGVVADVIRENGYQFIPDDRIPEMARALRPFMVAA